MIENVSQAQGRRKRGVNVHLTSLVVRCLGVPGFLVCFLVYHTLINACALDHLRNASKLINPQRGLPGYTKHERVWDQSISVPRARLLYNEVRLSSGFNEFQRIVRHMTINVRSRRDAKSPQLAPILGTQCRNDSLLEIKTATKCTKDVVVRLVQSTQSREAARLQHRTSLRDATLSTTKQRCAPFETRLGRAGTGQ